MTTTEKRMSMVREFLAEAQGLQTRCFGTDTHFEIEARNYEHDDDNGADTYGIIVNICWYDYSKPEDDQFCNERFYVYTDSWSCNAKALRSVMSKIKRVLKSRKIKL